MNRKDKELFLAKVQEIETKFRELMTWVEGLEFPQATLFDHVEDNPVLVPAESAESAESATPAASPRRARARITDGSLTASSIAARLTKELQREIRRENVAKLGKQIGAHPVYCKTQHASRYSAEEVKKIMDLFRYINQLNN